MNLIEELKKENDKPFSSYLISGDFSRNKKDIFEFLKENLNFDVSANSDFLYFKERQLSMRNSKKIKLESLLTKNSKNGYKIFLIETRIFQEIIQNSLLKTMEDAPHGTIFFILVPDFNNILDTIKSRSRLIYGNISMGSDRAINFLNSSFLDREEIIKKIFKKHKEPKDYRDDFTNFLNELEIIILENKKKIDSNFYGHFLELKKQANSSGANIKNIMSFLAIFLPKI